MLDKLFCAHCKRPLDERQLSMKSLTVESCPFCGTKVRESEGMRFTNLEAVIIEDVSSIDTWLDTYAHFTGVSVRKLPVESPTFKWEVETTTPWACELSYLSDCPSILEFRLVSTEIGEAIFEQTLKLQTICAKFGCQHHGNRYTDGMTGEVIRRWGAVQYLSTSALCEDLIEPVTQRLGETMNAVRRAFSGEAS